MNPLNVMLTFKLADDDDEDDENKNVSTVWFNNGKITLRRTLWIVRLVN